MRRAFLALCAAAAFVFSDAFKLPTPSAKVQPRSVAWGLADFLQGRGGDFVKMGGKQDVRSYGPPVLLLGGFPLIMETEEFENMVADAAPRASKLGLGVHRVTIESLGLSVEELLDAASVGSSSVHRPKLVGGTAEAWDVPVLYFSGMDNGDIRSVSKLILSELYEETGQRAAMAKAVPPALSKLARQMFEEIQTDHTEALAKLAELDGSRRE